MKLNKKLSRVANPKHSGHSNKRKIADYWGIEQDGGEYGLSFTDNDSGMQFMVFLNKKNNEENSHTYNYDLEAKTDPSDDNSWVLIDQGEIEFDPENFDEYDLEQDFFAKIPSSYKDKYLDLLDGYYGSKRACDGKCDKHDKHDFHDKHSQDSDFDTAIELDDLAQSAEDDLGKDESEVKKAEWIATRIAERKLKAKLNDEVMHHLASMGSKTAMLAVGKILDRKAFDSYKKEAKTFKPSKALRLNREARLKRWANRKIAYGDDWEIFIGAVEDPTNGEWVTLPTSDSDIDAAIERAQEGPDGEFYEEVMIADTTFGAGADIEYMDPHEVNEYISDFENSGYDKDFIQTLIDDLGFEQAANEIDDVEYYEDVNDEQDLGYAVVEALGGVENLDPDTLQSYFNYESFGRDLTFEGYNIDNGFAYRVAMHNRLARKIDTMRVIALIEKNLK